MPTTRRRNVLAAAIVGILVVIVGLVIVATTSFATEAAPDDSTAIITENFGRTIDVRPPDILSVRMNPTGDPQARCDHMGGRYYPPERLCYSVDY